MTRDTFSFNRKTYLSCEVEQQARVVQRLDNAIHRINHYPADNVVCFVTFIQWILIYPVDSVIQPLNNWGQDFNKG